MVLTAETGSVVCLPTCGSTVVFRSDECAVVNDGHILSVLNPRGLSVVEERSGNHHSALSVDSGLVNSLGCSQRSEHGYVGVRSVLTGLEANLHGLCILNGSIQSGIVVCIGSSTRSQREVVHTGLDLNLLTLREVVENLYILSLADREEYSLLRPSGIREVGQSHFVAELNGQSSLTVNSVGEITFCADFVKTCGQVNRLLKRDGRLVAPTIASPIYIFAAVFGLRHVFELIPAGASAVERGHVVLVAVLPNNCPAFGLIDITIALRLILRYIVALEAGIINQQRPVGAVGGLSLHGNLQSILTNIFLLFGHSHKSLVVVKSLHLKHLIVAVVNSLTCLVQSDGSVDDGCSLLIVGNAGLSSSNSNVQIICHLLQSVDVGALFVAGCCSDFGIQISIHVGVHHLVHQTLSRLKSGGYSCSGRCRIYRIGNLRVLHVTPCNPAGIGAGNIQFDYQVTVSANRRISFKRAFVETCFCDAIACANANSFTVVQLQGDTRRSRGSFHTGIHASTNSHGNLVCCTGSEAAQSSGHQLVCQCAGITAPVLKARLHEIRITGVAGS